MGLVGFSRRGRRRRRPANSAVLARAAVLTALAALLAACSSSGSASSAATSASPGATGTGGTASASAAAASFVNIVEPFDPGHPARFETAPASCGSQATTIAMEQCYQTKTENVDVQIDVAQSARYASAAAAERATILAQDGAWLAARGPVCAVAFNTGGTIDGINLAACLLDESNARLDAVKGITPPEAVLKGTDSVDPNQLSWYTTPEGSRIVVHRRRHRRAAGPHLSPRSGGPGVPVLHRLLHLVQGSQREQERRGLLLRARHSGRRLALTPVAAPRVR